MDKKNNYDEFLSAVNPDYQNWVNQMHEFLLKNGCKEEIKPSKSGYLVTYTDKKTNKALFNYVFRKSGLMIRIYGNYANHYVDFIDELPNGMKKSIEKASACKRLINPNTCNSRCAMGYDFIMNGERQQKCRNSSFMFSINDENNLYIKSFVEHELNKRMEGIAYD